MSGVGKALAGRATRPVIGAQFARRALPDTRLLVVGTCGYALLVAFLLARRGPLAAVLIAAIPLGLLLLTPSYRAQIVALVVILVVPAWIKLGVSYFDVGRAASLLAVVMVVGAREYRPRLLDLALVLFVLSAVLSWFLEYSEPYAGRILAAELAPVGFYIGVRVLPRERIRLAINTVLIAGTLGALTVIVEWAHGSSIFIAPPSYIWSASSSAIFRPGGVFAGPPDASTVLCFVILFGVASLGRFRGVWRAAVLGSVVVCTTALVLTFTRAAFIALGASLILFLWLSRSQLLRPLRVAWIVAGTLLVYFAIAPTLQSSTTFQEGIVRPGTFTSRTNYWRTALPISTSNATTFVVGVGSGALEAPTGPTPVPVAAKLAERPQVFLDSLHSQYITVLVEQGVVGLSALVFLMLGGFLPAARAARRTGNPNAAPHGASVFAMAVVMVVDTVFFDAASFAMLMFSLALSTRLPELMGRAPDRQS